MTAAELRDLGADELAAKEREEILRSRVDSTRVVGEAIARAKRPPSLWLQASTATIYAHRYDASNDEHTGIIGGHEPDVPEEWRFSVEVAKAWEQALDDARAINRDGTKRVLDLTDPAARAVFDDVFLTTGVNVGDIGVDHT